MSDTKRPMHKEINAGSMSDIAFLLLIYFLVTTTISDEKGLLVRLPEYSEDPEETMPILKRNVLSVFINADNQLMVEGELLNIEMLKEKTKNFIVNPSGNHNLAELPALAVVSLRNDRGTAYQSYIAVYNELKAAYNELWDEFARQKYDKNYEALSKSDQKMVRDRIPLVISEAEPTEFGEEH